MVVLKDEAEQLQRQSLENKLTRYSKEYDKLLVRKNKAKSEEARNKVIEKINNLCNKIEKAKLKFRDMYYMCLDCELSPCVNADMVYWYLEQLFPAGDGDKEPYISTMIMPSKGNEARRMMNMAEFRKKALHLLGLESNTYISHCNYIHRIKRSQRNKRKEYDGTDFVYRGPCKECVHSTQTIVIDLDYRNTKYGYTMAEDFYDMMKEQGAFERYGEPSFCVVSSEGQGIQLVYLLDEPFLTYFSDWRIRRYEKAVKEISAHFHPFGADASCCTINHLFRMPCSYNIRTKTWGYLLHWDRLKDDEQSIPRYAFSNFETPNEPIAKPHKQPKELPKQPKNINTPSTDTAAFRPNRFKETALRRCADLELLLELRHGDMIGHRNRFLFIYLNQYALVHCSSEQLLNVGRQLNEKFIVSLPFYEIKSIVKATLVKLHKFTDASICEMLDITEDEVAQFQAIKHHMTHAEADKRYRIRKGLFKNSAAKLAERNEKIIERYKEGKTTKELAAEFDLSTRQILRALKGAS